MYVAGPTWTEFFNKAMDKGMTIEEAKEFCKEFKCDKAKEAIEKLTKEK